MGGTASEGWTVWEDTFCIMSEIEEEEEEVLNLIRRDDTLSYHHHTSSRMSSTLRERMLELLHE